MNYSVKLEKLKDRRFDRELQQSVLSSSFTTSKLPDNIKYIIESMIPINNNYNKKTKEAGKRVQNHLENNFNLHFKRDYRPQGSVMTKTNIKVHSDYDLLTIISRYYYPEPKLQNLKPYTASDPIDDIKELRRQAENILGDIYDEVNKEGTKSISIRNKSLNRTVDVVFCFWYHIEDYLKSQDEYYRGIYLFDFPKEKQIIDYPFAHMQKVNAKGAATNDGSRKGIRLLKSIKMDSDSDSEKKIKLSSFHLTTLVHQIENRELYYEKRGSEIMILNAMLNQVKKMILQPNYRKSIESPNATEKPFSNDDILIELEKLEFHLIELMVDASKELNIPRNKKELIYY